MLHSVGVPDERLLRLTNGFDESLVPPLDSKARLRSELGLPMDEFVFVNVAFIEPKKDHSTLLEAFRLVRLARNSAKLCIIGDGPLAGRVRGQATELGLDEHVRFVGSVTPTDVLRWMIAGDAVVNYSRAEGNPTVMFEALGCGRPYIGSAVGGVPEVIESGSVGLVGPPASIECLRDLMIRAMEAQWNEARIQETAQQYTWKSIATRIHNEVFARSSSGQVTQWNGRHGV
ncbi:MAG: glycosyltransferase [Candidatus Binatia bacterium]